jgi:hypothetical protein
MAENIYPKVVSFVVRFVQDEPRPKGPGGYRGLIRHVQTDQAFAFTDWKEAQNFMERYIQLSDQKE